MRQSCAGHAPVMRQSCDLTRDRTRARHSISNRSSIEPTRSKSAEVAPSSQGKRVSWATFSQCRLSRKDRPASLADTYRALRACVKRVYWFGLASSSVVSCRSRSARCRCSAP
jgi:hypothetical protein